MNGRGVGEQLVRAGLAPPEVLAKTALYDSVLRAFSTLSGRCPDHVWWIPGRLEVFGTHTDYAGGRTLVAALPRGFAFVAAGREDGRVELVDAVHGESFSANCARDAAALSGTVAVGWRHYVEVVIQRLARNFPGARLGADIAFGSDLPRAAGMSSSSALMVGVATALVRLAGIRERSDWQDNVRGPLDEAGYYACIENGRSFGELTGDEGVGTHGGSEDHAAVLCGVPGALSAYAFIPMRHLDTVRIPDAWHIAVASSGVSAEKTGPARALYNRLARGAGVLLELWQQSEGDTTSLASALASDTSAAARLRSLVRASHVDGWPAEALEARLEHFIREDARVSEAVHAFRNAGASALATIAAASQWEAEHFLKNQISETAALARTALACGAFGARSFGAGFGGSVWALVERERGAGFADAWLEAYRRDHPARLDSTAFPAHPGPPVTELAL